MISVSERGGELHVVDAEKNEVTIRVTDWKRGGTTREIDRRVDETISGSVSSLQFPEAGVCIESEESDQWAFFGNEIGPHRLEPMKHLVQIEANITTFVQFDGGATVQRVGLGDDVIVMFDEETRVTIGFRSKVRWPSGELTIPPTTEGIANGISYLSAAIETTSPDRSYPSLRGHPPLIEFGEELHVPDEICDDVSETGIEIHVPNDLASVFVVSPLVYYLQASLVTSTDEAPRLEVPSIDYELPLRPLPALQNDVADLVYRNFFLDCLIRNVGPYGTDLAEYSLVDDLDIDAHALYEAPPEERLMDYLDIPFHSIKSELPDWHLSAFVEPEVSYTPSLAYLLDRLSLLYLPQGTMLEKGELIEQSLDETYRSTSATRWDGTESEIELLKPATRCGQSQGWLAEGTPIDAFKLLPEAFENRFDFTGVTDGKKTVTVVLNEPKMDEEQSIVERIYLDRSEELSIEVGIKEELTKQELIDVFEQSTDFVHYIGHCDQDGLRCSDGKLSVSDLQECNVRTFFLNACGSYSEGVELVRKGSVAGAVTLQRVLDRQATRVGTAFARLVIHGFSIDRALRLARCRAVMSKGYAAIGDGTYTLAQGDNRYPTFLEVEYLCQDNFRILMNHTTPNEPGIICQPYIRNESKYLPGNETSFEISRSELLSLLSYSGNPVIFENCFYWTDELYNELRIKKS